MTASNSSVSISVLLSLICLGLAVMFVGGWYFQSSLVELKVQEEETIRTVQQLKEKVTIQNKQLIELQLQLEQVSLGIYMYIYIYIYIYHNCR